MTAIETWTKNKPFLIAAFGPQMAVVARDINEAFKHTKERRIFKHKFDLPHLPTWFALYRTHNKPLFFLKTLISDFSGFSSTSIEFGENVIEGFQQLSNLPQGTPITITVEELEQVNVCIQKALSESLADIKSDMTAKDVDPQTKAAMLSLLTDMDLEGSFFLLVTVPCWLLYQIHPGRLYRKARQGNFDALKNLLNLDPLMIHDPMIGKQIQKLRFKNKSWQYETLFEILLKESTINVTPQQMKYALGGFLSALAKLLKVRLTAPDIQKLYDAVALDFDGVRRDSCLPDNSGTFAQAIYRYRKEWLKAFKSDMKN